MSTINPPNNGILVLRPPQVRGATHPVVGGDIGVALVIYDLVLDGLGAHVSVDPPLSGTTDPGDEIELWNEGDSAVLDSKTIVDPNAVMPMRIPKGRLHPDRINKLYYTVRRASSNIGTSTPLLATLYNKIRPGLKDTKPDQDGHSELGMTLSDEIKNGVGPGFVSAQICFTYPYCRANDIITLKCNGELKTFKVSSNEAPNPPDPGSAIPTTVCFIVDRPFLESAVRPSGTFDFSYTVTDQLGNTPDTYAIWSASQTVEEDLAGLLLKPLILRELLSDALDPSETFDLGKVATEFWAIILTNDPRFEAGHTIVVTLVIKNPGKPDVTLTGTGTVEVDEFGQNKPCPVKFDFDPSVIVKGAQIKGTYKLLNGEQLVASSRAANIQVIGNSVPELVVDTSDLQLYGQNVSIHGTDLPWISTGIDPDHTTAERKISGGVPPYTIQSSDEGIASTHGNLLIRSEGNGNATITITDAANQKKFINVKCANVMRVLHNPSILNHEAAVAWVQSTNGSVISDFEKDIWILTISKKYIGPLQTFYHRGAPELHNSIFYYDGRDHPTAPSKWWSGIIGGLGIHPVICFKR